MGGGEELYSHVTKSKSCHRPGPLGCVASPGVSPLSQLFSQPSRVKDDGDRGQTANSVVSPAGTRLRQASFPRGQVSVMRNTFGVFHNCYTFSSPPSASWRFLMALPCENPAQFLEVTSTKVWATSRDHGPRSFPHTWSPAIHQRGCAFLAPEGPAPGKQTSALSLWIPLCLQSGGLPCDPSSLMCSGKAIDFQVFGCFLVVRMRVTA